MDKPIEQLIVLRDMDIPSEDKRYSFKFKFGSPVPVVGETDNAYLVYAIPTDKDGEIAEEFLKDYINVYGVHPRVEFYKKESGYALIGKFREI
jgi:hypothetical protein